MNFGQAISSGLENYFNFTGKATRKEFWWFALFVALLRILALILDVGIFQQTLAEDRSGPIGGLVFLTTLIPIISIAIRRLRDAGMAWYYLFVAIFPLFGGIIIIVLLSKPSIPPKSISTQVSP